MTTAEQLSEVQAAITAILVGGQEYQIGNKKLRRADLNELKKMEKDLQDRLDDESGTTRAYVAWGR